MSDEQVISVGGATIALQEYGDPAGTPVIFCHGWPSSRTMAELTDQAGRELRVRIIAPDRPGICRSPYQENRSVLDWPPVMKAIADHFGISQFRVLGISGGAPYTFATAWAMPERITAVAVVSGAPPIQELSNHDGLMPLYRLMLAFNQKFPALLRAGFHLARPFVALRPSINLMRQYVRLLQPCDAESLRDAAAFHACFESQRRAWEGSARGVIADAQIHAHGWGFPLEEVSVPVRLWHGKKDRSFKPNCAEEVARRLPNCQMFLVDNAGHFSLPIRHMRRILADLVATK